MANVTRRWFVTCGALLVTAAAADLEAPRAQPAPASAGPPDPKLVEDLVAANRILVDQSVLDGYGHVSARHDRDPNRYLMSRSLGPELVTAADIMEYDLDSNPVDAKGRTSVLERYIHGEIYKVRPDVTVVIHSHAPAVIPFSVTKVPLRPVYHMASFLWVGVPVWDVRSVKDPDAAALLVRNSVLGHSLAVALGDKPIALLRGHGNVVVGADIPLM